MIYDFKENQNVDSSTINILIPTIESFIKLHNLKTSKIYSNEISNFSFTEFQLELISNNIEIDSILDLISFTNTNNTQNEIDNLKILFIENLKKIKFNGIFFFLINVSLLTNINEWINSEFQNESFLLKTYCLSQKYSIYIFSIQKFKTKCLDSSKQKIRFYFSINQDKNKIDFKDILLLDLNIYTDYSKDIFQNSIYLSKYNLGQNLRTEILISKKEQIYFYSVSIFDSSYEDYLKNNICKALIILPNFNSSQFEIEYSFESIMEQLKLSRLIVIKPNPMFCESLEEIKSNVSIYLSSLFHNENINYIEILTLQDTRNEKTTIFSNESFIIYDVKDNSDDYIRQIVDLKSNNIICEIAIKLINKKDSKATNLIYLPNTKNYEAKGKKPILNESQLLNLDLKFALLSYFFIENNKKHDALIYDSEGINIFSFFLKKFYNNEINIYTHNNLSNQSKENFNKIKVLEKSHLGLDFDFQIIENGNKNKNKFSFIFKINNFTEEFQDSFPDPSFFGIENLLQIKEMLHEKGLFILSLKVKSKIIMNKYISILKEIFGKIYFFDNFDNFNRTLFIFNEKFPKEYILFIDRLEPNLKLYMGIKDDNTESENEINHNRSILGENIGVFMQRLIEVL